MRFFLPPATKPLERDEALRYHYALGLRELYQKSATWTRTHWYLLGLRNYQGLWSTGLQSFEDRAGQRTVRWERTLAALQTDIGRIMQINVEPAVVRPPGVTMQGVRDTALAQAALDYMVGPWNLDRIKMGLGYHLSAFGTAGLGVWGPGTPGITDRVYLDVIPGWELQPLPGVISSSEAGAGLVRRRWVDVDWLRENMGGLVSRFPSAKDLGARQTAPGAHLTLKGDPTGSVRETGTPDAQSLSERRRTSKVARPGHFVLLKEYWLYGPEADSCARWIVQAGNKTLYDIDYQAELRAGGDESAELPIVPVQVARYLGLGSFYGRGLADRLLYLNQEIEQVLGNLLSNLSDVDWFGMLMMPADMGMNLNQFKEARKNRFGTYLRDLGGASDVPLRLGPNNVGTMGAPAIELVTQMMGAITNQGDLFAGKVPGRLESARALGVYLETQQIPMSPVAEGIASAFAGCYRGLLSIGRTILPDQFPLRLTRLDSAILGVKVNPQTGMVSVNPHGLPSPYSVDITIRNKAPESAEQKMELLDRRLEMGVISPVDYQILAMREGLEGDTLLDQTRFESYRKAEWENIVLFGDGITPGEVRGSVVGDIHPLHRRTHAAPMASIAMTLASEEVREAFLQHIEDHDSFVGMPTQMPVFDELGAGEEGAIPPELMAQMEGAAGPPTPGAPNV